MKKISCFLCFIFFFQLSFGSGHFVYEIREDGVYGGTYGLLTKIEGADPKTFKFIDGHESAWGLVVTYAKDKNRVYYYATIVKGADPESFEVLGKWYVKDKNHVYNADKNHEIYEGYDASTFEILGNWFVKDKDGVYYEHNISEKAIKIKGTDAASFEILWGTNYLKDKSHVYYYQEIGSGGLSVKVFVDADPNTFVVDVASSPYSRDAKNIYWNGEKLPGANPNTFKLIMKTSYGTDGKNVYFQSVKLLDADAGKFRLESSNIGVTDRYVYYWGSKLEGIYPGNFVFCSTSYHDYIKNDSVVYYHNIRIKEADAATFEASDWRKAKDKNNRYVEDKIDEETPVEFAIYESGVYFNNRESDKLPGADPKTFKILNKYYGKDKKAVYWIYYEVKNADVATFELVTEYIGKDKTAVYHGRDKIVGANPKTYIPLKSLYGKDSKNVFFEEKTMSNVDLSSFEVINYIYSKDKSHIFFRGKIIENSDSESFQEEEYPFCKDKNHAYFEGKIIEYADPAL